MGKPDASRQAQRDSEPAGVDTQCCSVVKHPLVGSKCIIIGSREGVF